MTNATRVGGSFLLPFLAFVPLGLIQMVTVRRTPASLLIFLGFALAPFAACLVVLEPYASDRELVVLPFGVLIAAFGIERLRGARTRWMLAFAFALFALVPLHFFFFEFHYFGDYHRRSPFWFEWNHRGGLEAIIALEDRESRPIFLSTDDDPMMEVYWRFALLKHRREELQQRTVDFSARRFNLSTVPRRSLILFSRRDEAAIALLRAGTLTQLLAVPEPGDIPYYFVAEH